MRCRCREPRCDLSVSLQPALTHVCRWARDPYARGVFSYIPEGASLADVENVALPLPVHELDPNQRQRRSGNNAQAVLPRLFFAGEHAHSGGIGTIQGAMMSGLKAVADVCKFHFPGVPNVLSRLPGSLQFKK